MLGLGVLAAAAQSHEAGSGVLVAIVVGLMLLGLALILDTGGLRSWLVEDRMKQYEDHPWIARVFAERTEAATRASHHRWTIAGGAALIGMAVWIVILWRG